MSIPLRRRSVCAALWSGIALPRLARSGTAVPLEIGLLPNLSARVLLAQYQPLREFLAREWPRPVQLSTAPNWAVFHQRTLALEYDLVVTAANLARLAQVDRGYLPLLSYTPRIKGLLVQAGARPLDSLAELRGQTLVLSNPQSLVALRGLQWLAENGLLRDRDFRTINTPTDDSVGSVVVRGDAIAALVSGGEFRAIPDALRAQLQIQTAFAEVPGFIVMASPRLAVAEALALKAAMLKFAGGSDEGKAFFAATGFTGMQEPAAGLMESLDPYVEASRRVLAPT
jgi:phosphonate transport system substrate-binding protein